MRRLIILLYGVLSYGVFLASFLYAIAFVGSFPGFKSIDSGVAGSPGRALLIDIFLLALFAIQHSVMARQPFKRQWTKIIPEAAERSSYVLLASLLLFMLDKRPLPREVWQVTNVPAAALLDVLFWSGWLIVLVSTFLIDHFDLFGLRLHAIPGAAVPTARVQDVRLLPLCPSPHHGGFHCCLLGRAQNVGGPPLFAFTTTAYILVAIVLEERDLTGFYGERYGKYRDRVWALLPLSRFNP